jgi:uncharacterized cofD-like protein
VDAGQSEGRRVNKLWLEPDVAIRPAAADAIRSLDAIVIGPGSFFTSLLPIFLVGGCREAVAAVKGPVIFIANLVTEGRGMEGFTTGDAVARLEEAIGRSVDVVIVAGDEPDRAVLERYAREHKLPMPLGKIPSRCQVVEGAFWGGEFARHDRGRLTAAVWAVLAGRLLATRP